MAVPRYSIIPADLLNDNRATNSHVRVMCEFGKESDRNGWLRANQSVIAGRAGTSRETVNRIIRDLVEWGYLRKLQRFSEKDGRQMINEYQVLMDRADPSSDTKNVDTDAVESDTPCDAHITPPCDAQITGGVMSGDHTPCDVGITPIRNRPLSSTTPSLSPERGRAARAQEKKHDPEGFEKAFRAWPTSVADDAQDAWRAWQAMAPPDRERAADDAQRYVTALRAVGRTLLCSFAKYLQERRWEGLPARPAPAMAKTEAERKEPPRPPKPTAFQQANPHLFPEIFGNVPDQQGAAT